MLVFISISSFAEFLGVPNCVDDLGRHSLWLSVTYIETLVIEPCCVLNERGSCLGKQRLVITKITESTKKERRRLSFLGHHPRKRRFAFPERNRNNVPFS